MKQGWEYQRLEDCFKLKSGDGLTSKMMSDNGEYPVFGGNGIAGFHNEFNLSDSNVIIGRVGALCGNVRYMNEKIWLTDNAFRIVDFKYEFDHSFLTYLLNFKNLREYARQAAQPVISNSSLKDVILEFPKSLPEQQRIVAILDEAFAAIEGARANAALNLKNAKELFNSYLQGVFENRGEEWEEKTLGEIADIKGGKRVPKGYKLEFEKTSHPYIRVADFNDYGSIDLNDIRYINEKVFKEIQNYTISKHDLYISIAGTIGKTGIVPDELDGANLTENACKLVFKENINKKFVYFFTKTKSFEIQAGLNTRTAAMPKLALTRLSTIKLSIPKSVQMQNNFVEEFEALFAQTKRLEAIYQQKIDNLEELKKSILQKAFNGEL